MPEMRVYACDGGCGAQIALAPLDSLSRHGWHHNFPAGGGQTFACSATCMQRALEPAAAAERAALGRSARLVG